jgi:hypothetical protein
MVKRYTAADSVQLRVVNFNANFFPNLLTGNKYYSFQFIFNGLLHCLPRFQAIVSCVLHVRTNEKNEHFSF